MDERTAKAVQEEIAKNKAQAQTTNEGHGAALHQGSVGWAEPARPGLRERVAMDLHRARKEHQKLDRLYELQQLLGQYPDIARILDLLEEVRG